MNLDFYGKNFPHEPFEFCAKRKLECHFISFFLTDYVYEKSGTLLRGKGGDMLIMPAGEIIYHGPTPEMNTGFINDWAYVYGDGFIKRAAELSLPIGIPFSVGGERHLARFIEKADKEKAFSEESHEKMIELFMEELLIRIARSYKKSGENNTRSKITALRGEFAQDPKKNWTLEEMSKRCGYSESRFSSLYRSVYGISPIKDLLNIRLENAKLLLLYSSRSIYDIAFEVGFSSVFYFSNYFKRCVGVSPKEYRLNRTE